MVIKVCGINTQKNLHEVSEMDIDMIGLNFYPPSVRYVIPETSSEHFDIIPRRIKRVGVFVNESLEKINELAIKHELDYIQLHGDEDIKFCKSVARNHKIIKVFRIDHQTNFKNISEYSFADYYLFDTATKHFGGSGKKFDWSILKNYNEETPFLLSGGIGPLDSDAILEDIHPMFAGIDINSKFETEPGVKNAQLLLPFLQKVRNQT